MKTSPFPSEPRSLQRNLQKAAGSKTARLAHTVLLWFQQWQPCPADVRLRAGGRDFAAHRHVLSARSPVFLSLFASGAVEATGAVELAVELAVECSAELFSAFLDFFYSGALGGRGCAELVALLELAERYEVAELKAECVRQLLAVGVGDALQVPCCLNYILHARKNVPPLQCILGKF